MVPKSSLRLLTLCLYIVLSLGCEEAYKGKSVESAAMDGDLPALKAAIARGEDVNARNRFGDTPLHVAVNAHQFEAAKLLISHGADVNAKNILFTPLHSAAEYGDPQMVRFLLDHGADANAKNALDATPAEIAAKAEHPEIVKMLMEHLKKKQK